MYKKDNMAKWLFWSVFTMYMVISSGNLGWDQNVRWAVARQIVEKGEISVPIERHGGVGKGHDGKNYAFYQLGQTLLFLPFAVLSMLMVKFLGVSPAMADYAGQFLVSLTLLPAVGAALVLLFYRILELLGYARDVALVAALIMATATMMFYYGSFGQEQTHVGLLLLMAIYVFIKHTGQFDWSKRLFFSLLLGGCILFRLPSVVMIVPLFVAGVILDIIATERSQKFRVLGQWLLAGLAGTVGFIVICGWYNYMKFGSVFDTGYSRNPVPGIGQYGEYISQPVTTLLAILFSPGKGLLFYNPVLLVIPFALIPFCRQHKKTAWLIAGPVLGNLVFYSFLLYWAGDYAWGPRYQVTILPLLMLPLATLLVRMRALPPKIGFGVLVAVSIVVQLASVAYNAGLEFAQNSNHTIIPQKYCWDFSESHLTMRFRNIFNHVRGARSFERAEVLDPDRNLWKYDHGQEYVRMAYTIHFFPFKARAHLSSRAIFNCLLALWIILILCFLFSSFKLYRACISHREECSRQGRTSVYYRT